MAKEPIVVGARESPLSQAQFHEISDLLPQTVFKPLYFKTTGDVDLKTSLRTLEKTDFFTKEIDEALLEGKCRIAIHSAKDLPDPLPEGLKLIALTRGVDASDSLVFKEGYTLESLPQGALIATSSKRREQAVSALRNDLTFCDIRGTIQQRLQQMKTSAIKGVVIAEAALIRLQLTHLPRITLPGPSTPLQGQLAVIARSDDVEMQKLFSPLDVRNLPKALYFTPHLPLHAFPEYWLHAAPLLQRKPYPSATVADGWKCIEQATHLILTSKNSVRTLQEHFLELQIPLEILQNKTIIAVGNATAHCAKALKPLAMHVALDETQEGMLALIKSLGLQNAFILYPHAAQARPFLREQLDIPHKAFAIYSMEKDPLTVLPDLNAYQYALFTSPSTVKSFFDLKPAIPETLTLKAIGPITEQVLKEYESAPSFS
jgi:hydroxymethylbilane synthase